MAKSQKKIEAINLRKKGLSIKYIAKKLNVSTSSVSLWTRDIILTQEQYKVLESHARDPLYGKRLDYINHIKLQTNKKVEELKRKGINEVGLLSKRELFLVGIALYWSEGFKKDSHRSRIREIERHWSDLTNIPLNNFRKPYFQNVKWKKIYDHPDEYYGLLRVKVLKSKDFLRKIQGYIEGLRLQTRL